MIVHYQSQLREKDLLPEEIHTFRFNSITSKNCISFAHHPDDMSLVSSIGDMTTTQPANSGLSENFKLSYSPAGSLKKSFKRDASIFTTFKGKYWYSCLRNTTSTAREQEIAEVLNPDYRPVTKDDVIFFRKNHKFMHAVFDKTL